MKLTLASLGLALLAMSYGSGPSRAMLVDQGTTTFDPLTGLTWLDLTPTIMRSHDDVAVNLNPGGDFFGYRFAENSEVETLLSNAGLVFGNFRGVDPLYSDFIDLFDSGATGIGGTTDNGIDAYRVGTFSNPFQTGYFLIMTSTSIPSLPSAFGSWLVQGVPPAPVPVPAAFPLLVAGLGLIGLFGWRSKRTAAAANKS